MNKMVKYVMGMALILGLPLCASAQDGTQGYQDATNQVSRTATEQYRTDKAAMRRIERKEDSQSTGEYLNDSAITAKVKGKFVGQEGLDSLDIKVITVDGEVTLMGDVNSQAQIGLAESAAKQVEGVKSVENKLVIKQ